MAKPELKEPFMLSPLFLSIDAGNSNIVFGFLDLHQNQWVHEFRIETKKGITTLEMIKILRLLLLEKNLDPGRIIKIGFSSVVPALVPTIQDLCLKLFGMPAYTIKGHSYTKLRVWTDRPNEIGTDLMSNIAAAYQYFSDACIVVDFGTALTFSVVDDKGYVV